MKTILLLLVFLFIAGPALAAGESAPVDSLQVLVDQQRDLKAKLDSGDEHGLTARQVKQVRKAQEEFFSIAEGKSTLDQLSIDEKVSMENALERINAEIKNTRVAADGQNVCWRERVSGSKMKTTRCGTEAERREAREGARDFMEKPKVCVPPGCGASP